MVKLLSRVGWLVGSFRKQDDGGWNVGSGSIRDEGYRYISPASSLGGWLIAARGGRTGTTILVGPTLSVGLIERVELGSERACGYLLDERKRMTCGNEQRVGCLGAVGVDGDR